MWSLWSALLLLTVCQGTRAAYRVVKLNVSSIVDFDQTTFEESVFGEHKQRFRDACDGYATERNETATPWVSLFTFEKTRFVFQCCEGDECREEEKTFVPRVLKAVSNQFERNRPQRWFIRQAPDELNCRDSLNRSMPLPLGVRSCMMYGASLLSPQGDADHVAVTSPANQLEHSSWVHRCHDAFHFKPTTGSLPPGHIGDRECVVRMLPHQSSYICCCYNRGSDCRVGVISTTGFACPSLNQTLSLNADDLKSTTNGTTLTIPMRELARKDTCVVQITVQGDAAGTLEVGLDFTDQSVCAARRNQDASGCHLMRNPCYSQFEQFERFCCFLTGKRKDTGFLIHELWGSFFLQRQKLVYSKMKQCRMPSAHKDYCVYFVDQWSRRLVNPHFEKLDDFGDQRATLQLTDISKANFETFKKETTMPAAFGDVELHGFMTGEAQEFLVEQDCPNMFVMDLPNWFPISVSVVKCRTPSDASKRCDENVDAAALVKSVLKPKHLCDTTRPGVTEPSVNAICMEWIEQDTSGRMLYERGAEMPLLRRLLTHHKDAWDNVDRSQNNVAWHCMDFERNKVPFALPNGNRAVKACMCLNAPRCNRGYTVRTMHEVESMPAVVKDLEDHFLGPGAADCNLKSATTNKNCIRFLEKNHVQACVFGMAKHKTQVGIGCLRTSLNQRKQNNRIAAEEFPDYHVYMLNETISVDYGNEEAPYRCVVRDNHFDSLIEPDIVCLCRAGACDEPHQQMVKKHKFKRIGDL